MFSKMFGKTSSKIDKNTHTHDDKAIKTDITEHSFSREDIENTITETLTHYTSDNFPNGVLVSCAALTFSYCDKASSSVNNQQQVTVSLTMPFACQGELDNLAQSLNESLPYQVIFIVELKIKPVRQFSLKNEKNKSQSNIANIIAIASGKGGVGKSTTTVNLAYALMSEGAKVGILDADIYGPSIPSMLGLQHEKPNSKDGKLMTPLSVNGLSAMSIGFLVDESDATVWRGPMASSAFGQLLNETDWPELDYLLIDMPPGTGDIQLTLAQSVPVAASVVVTTPQDIALIDAVKGIAMFDKVKVPVLGIVENMSYHLCDNCGHQSHIFGESGGEHIADDYETKLLGQLPLDIAIRQDADLGKSEIIENSAGEIANHYRKIARNISAQLFLQCDTASPLTAKVSVENSSQSN